MPLPRRPVLLPAVAVTLAALAVLTGCQSGSGPGGGSDGTTSAAGYTPVPDEELFADVRELPHVTAARLSFRDTAADGRLYSGTLTTDGAQDPYVVLDAATAILRQGRPSALVSITASGPTGREYANTELLDRTADDPLTARYGPQPGDGTPPADAPPPAPGWTPVSP